MDIVLVEDSKFYAEQLAQLLAKYPELQVVHQAGDEDEAVSSIMQYRPDAVILDLALKRGNGLGVLRRIRAAGCHARMFVLTNHSGKVVRDACLEAGAVNVFDKGSEALDCIQSILSGPSEQANAEAARLLKMHEIQLLGVQAVNELDRITDLAALLLKMPIATISLIDEKRLWNVSHHGTYLKETPRFHSFSARTILGTDILEFDNARSDPRIADSPLVSGDAAVAYYAGAPLILPTGESIGALCVMDRMPHRLSEDDKKVLSMLAKTTVTTIMQHIRMRYLEHGMSCLSDSMNGIIQMSSKDALTLLPNELIFKDRLGQQIRYSNQAQSEFAMLCLDLIDFKSINQRFGKEVGDEILVAFVARVSGVLRKADTVARLNANRFAFILPDVQNEAEVLLIANKIRTAVRTPWQNAQKPIYVDCCIGVSMFPRHADNVEDLSHHANASLQVAKRKARANHHRDDMAYIVSYDPLFIDETMLYANLEVEFRQALENHELMLYCQPQLDLDRGSLTGLEFLVRWSHPRLGVLGPDYFVPFAEQSGLIQALTDQVLDMALQQTHQWRQAGLHIPRVSVNVSGQDVRAGLCARIQHALEKHQVPAQQLEIEVTETAMTARGMDGLEELRALDRLRVSIAVDDFGTGFSSLSRIQSLPIACIKIDSSFVEKVEQSPNSQAICKAIVTMAHALGLRCVVEGIGTEQQHQFFKQLGATAGQGYFYGKPMATHKLEAWVAGLSFSTGDSL